MGRMTRPAASTGPMTPSQRCSSPLLLCSEAGTFDMFLLVGLRCFAVGSKDMSTWVFGAERWSNLIYYSLGGHKDVVVGCFFQKDSLDVS